MLPMGVVAPQFAARPRPAAAFLTQLIASRPPSPGTEASSAYRRAEESDRKRLPPGYRKTLSA